MWINFLDWNPEYCSCICKVAIIVYINVRSQKLLCLKSSSTEGVVTTHMDFSCRIKTRKKLLSRLYWFCYVWIEDALTYIMVVNNTALWGLISRLQGVVTIPFGHNDIYIYIYTISGSGRQGFLTLLTLSYRPFWHFCLGKFECLFDLRL